MIITLGDAIKELVRELKEEYQTKKEKRQKNT